MTTKTLFEPTDLTPDDEARLLLRERWPAPEHLSWLPDALRPLKALRRRDDDEQFHLTRVAESLTDQIDEAESAELLLTRYVAAHHKAHPDDAPALRAFVALARARGVDFTAGLRQLGGGKGSTGERLAAARSLSALGAEPEIVLDPSWLASAAAMPGPYPKKSEERVAEDDHLGSFAFQLFVDVPRAMEHAELLLDRAPASETATLAKALLSGIGTWSWAPRLHATFHDPRPHPRSYSDMDPALQPAALRIFGLLYARGVEHAELWKDPLFAEAVFRFWLIAFQGHEAETPQGMKKTLVTEAKRALGRLRTALVKPDVDAAAFFEREIDHIEEASRILFTLASLWDGMKPLLLLVRHSPIPVVAKDLSWWTGKDVANNAVAGLASHLIWSFQAFARFEQADDKELLTLRTELARFCIDRCKKNKERDEPTEPNALWRAAALRAAAELGVNPEGRGHQVAHFVMENDAEPAVRDAAKAVYARLREQRALPSGMSPRVAVLHALWWLRQAHVTALGFDVDRDGAQRTRAEEVRFTTAPAKGRDDKQTE